MTFKFLKIIGIGFILSVSTLANATFIDNGDYTTDTESGLDWLDWTETLNDTQAEALAEFSDDDWRIATAMEATDLLERYFGVSFLGSSYIVPGDIPNYTANISTFVPLFGPTNQSGIYSMMNIEGAGLFGITADYYLQANYAPYLPAGYGGIGYRDADSGVALVKTSVVTEPAIITIFALGFVGIGYARRRRQS
jgi:hypothetical protein